MRIVVIGGSSAIGSRLVDFYSNIDHKEVYSFSRRSFFPSNEIVFDYTNELYLDNYVRLLKPDVVINCVAISQIEECEQNKKEAWRVNVDFVRELSKTCFRYNVKLINLSTTMVYYWNTNGKKIESPSNYYGKSKLESDKYVSMFNNSLTIRLNPILSISQLGQRNNILNFIYDSIINDREVKLANDISINYLFMNDLLYSIDKLIDNAATGIIDLGGALKLSPFDLAIAMSKLLGRSDISFIGVSINEIYNDDVIRPKIMHADTINQILNVNYKYKSLEKSILDELKNEHKL